MKRREFVTQLGLVALGWPIAARAQRVTIPFVGILYHGFPHEFAGRLEGFRSGLKDGGFVDGKDVALEYRWAEGHYDRVPSLARELVDRNVAVIAAMGTMATAVAAKAATSRIPIVFLAGGDPVELGLVASLARPGGNVTGVLNLAISLEAKRLQVMRELVPAAKSFIYMQNPNNANAKSALSEVQAAAGASGIKIRVVSASNESEIDAVFGSIQGQRADILLVAADGQLTTYRNKIATLAARRRIPACYAFREFTESGGLMSYGANLKEAYRQAGVYTARILKGEKPADLPVIQSSTFELVFNLRVARSLGLSISREFLARVDEVIE